MKAPLHAALIALAFAQVNNQPVVQVGVAVDPVPLTAALLETRSITGNDFFGLEDLLAQAYEDEVYAALIRA